MVDSLREVDTSRAPEKPDLRPLPDERPEDATDHGWVRGLRDWYWSEIRHQLNDYTDGAANYNDRYYDLGVTVLGALEERARDKALAFPSDKCREWFRTGLKAASFSFGDDEEILFQGPESAPDRFLEMALSFVVRRADRALDLFGEETDSIDRDLSGLADEEEQEDAEPTEETGDPETAETPGGDPEEETGEEAPTPAPEQGKLF